jgi:DNA-binding FadR family transcriptional regulator
VSVNPESPVTLRLEPLGRAPLKERVVERLRTLIEEGVLTANEQLPSERELAEQLGVSRGTVREAVQFLHALGLVEIRHGLGTFVSDEADDRERLRANWRSWTLRHAAHVHELLEIRKAVEGYAAELAAERAGDAELAAIDKAWHELRRAGHESDVGAIVQADERFHHALCAASGNAFLAELLDMLAGVLVPERAAAWDLEDGGQRSVREHGAILEAVRARDGALAREAVLFHLASVETLVDWLAAASEAQDEERGLE